MPDSKPCAAGHPVGCQRIVVDQNVCMWCGDLAWSDRQTKLLTRAMALMTKYEFSTVIDGFPCCPECQYPVNEKGIHFDDCSWRAVLDG